MSDDSALLGQQARRDRAERAALPGEAAGEAIAQPAALGTQHAEERALVRAAQGGDLAAYEALVRRYEQVAFRVAYLVLRDAAEAEDAAQEAFVRAYRALGRFRADEPFRPWLLRIVANQAISGRRAAERRGALATRYEREARDDPQPSPESVALGHERRDAVLRGLAQLSADDRMVLHLRYFLDLGEAEVADALGCARGTVKSRLHRALGRLRPVLARAFPELAPPAEREREILA
ncbi:MAG TPA: sigma-70 family RNA polymerase sigma factor [Chloroflexota bacterium]|nr:sigma-70 family RNA polymerase sigma factor [Chloroflexota bacterium]